MNTPDTRTDIHKAALDRIVELEASISAQKEKCGSCNNHIDADGEAIHSLTCAIEDLRAQIKTLTMPRTGAADAYCQGHSGYTGDFLATVKIEEDAALLAGIAAVDRHATNAAIDLAARTVTNRRDDYVNEYGNYDPETGVTKFPGSGEEWVEEWEEIAEAILTLKGKE